MNNKNKLLLFLFIPLLLVHVSSLKVFAQSEYVLPYPSFMPGNKLYSISKFADKLEKYWYFGNFAQIAYNQKLSDKYLVEAKTLFEYKQYFLGYTALQKSNTYFEKIQSFIDKGKNANKNTKLKESLYRAEAKKHIEIILKMQKDAPENFTWTPEKGNPTFLDLNEVLEKSIRLRERVL